MFPFNELSKYWQSVAFQKNWSRNLIDFCFVSFDIFCLYYGSHKFGTTTSLSLFKEAYLITIKVKSETTWNLAPHRFITCNYCTYSVLQQQFMHPFGWTSDYIHIRIVLQHWTSHYALKFLMLQQCILYEITYSADFTSYAKLAMKKSVTSVYYFKIDLHDRRDTKLEVLFIPFNQSVSVCF